MGANRDTYRGRFKGKLAREDHHNITDTPNRMPSCPQRYPQLVQAGNTAPWTLKNKKAP